jgi:hypothetical protein
VLVAVVVVDIRVWIPKEAIPSEDQQVVWAEYE